MVLWGFAEQEQQQLPLKLQDRDSHLLQHLSAGGDGDHVGQQYPIGRCQGPHLFPLPPCSGARDRGVRSILAPLDADSH